MQPHNEWTKETLEKRGGVYDDADAFTGSLTRKLVFNNPVEPTKQQQLEWR